MRNKIENKNNDLHKQLVDRTSKIHAPQKRDFHLSLSDVKKGNLIKILQIPEGFFKTQMIRFGITEGETVKCLERLPGGTILIQKNRQEIAIGVKLAKNITVTKN
jgi:Fe2+ transport system protein FeoA